VEKAKVIHWMPLSKVGNSRLEDYVVSKKKRKKKIKSYQPFTPGGRGRVPSHPNTITATPEQGKMGFVILQLPLTIVKAGGSQVLGISWKVWHLSKKKSQPAPHAGRGDANALICNAKKQAPSHPVSK